MTLLVVKINYFICVGSFSRTNIQTELQQLKHTTLATRSRGTSVSVMFDYGLDDRSIGVRSPAGAKDFFLYPPCPDRLWCPPSLLSSGYRSPFPGRKARPERDADHSPPSRAKVWMIWSHTSSPPSTSMTCSGTALPLLLLLLVLLLLLLRKYAEQFIMRVYKIHERVSHYIL
jgi:hypothetical protein